MKENSYLSQRGLAWVQRGNNSDDEPVLPCRQDLSSQLDLEFLLQHENFLVRPSISSRVAGFPFQIDLDRVGCFGRRERDDDEPSQDGIFGRDRGVR